MTRGTTLQAVLLLFAIAGLSACSSLSGVEPAARAAPCAIAFTAERCEVIAVVMAREIGVDPARITGITVLPPPTPELGPDGRQILQIRSGGPSPDLQLDLDDGSVHVVTLHCGGISAGFVPACMEQPTLRVSSPTLGGYRDVPCLDEAGEHCATPHPEIEAADLASAEPIVVARRAIAVDAVGDIEVSLGTGSLPNGILSEATFELVDPWPEGLLIVDGTVHLEVRSLEPGGKPFHNDYEHGWTEGLERIEAFLLFHVDAFEPGASLDVRDIVVR